MDELIVATAGTGVARTSHYVTPTGASAPIQTLLLEPQRTNLCIRSEEFDTWASVSTCNVTANSTTAPDGATTADTLTPTTSGSLRSRSSTFTGDGEKAFSIYLKAGTSPFSLLRIFDATAAVFRHTVNVTWTNGVPTLATGAGAGTLYPVEALANGWYRILFSATGIVAANDNQFRIQPDPSGVTLGTLIAWGAQAENAIVPSSYIKTEATTVTRNADSLYFPASEALTERTTYARFVEAGTVISAFNVVTGFYTGISSPNFRIERGSSGTYRAAHNNGSADVSSTGTGTPTLGQIVEVRGVLRSAGAVLAGISINGGVEGVGSASAANAISATAITRLYIGGTSLSSPIAFTHVIVAAGEQSMATMRSLAGVA